MKKKKRLLKKTPFYVKILNGIGFAGTLCGIFGAGFIMSQKWGLVESLPFGGGAYYYTDIPGFEQWMDAVYYRSELSPWIIAILFLIWGFLMYCLWTKIDKLGEIKGQGDR